MNAVESPTSYPVDAEHGRLRLAILLVFFVSAAVSFLILSALVQSSGFNIIALLGCLAIGFAIAQLVERQLKTRWPSGRKVIVDTNGARLMRNERLEQDIPANEAVNAIYWRFEVRKRSRIPKGWFMCACALEHEDQMLAVYTFMSPKDFETYPRNAWFTLLSGKKEAEGKSDLRLAGEQRRLRDAENYRWLNGAEMTIEEFKRYIEQISTQFPEWEPLR